MRRNSYRSLAFGAALGLVVLIIVAVFSFVRLSIQIRKTTGLTPFSAFSLLTDGEQLLKSTNERTNVLILGIGGGDHEGPDLTDTIIVASYTFSPPRLSLISIPRDLWSEALKDRINSAYHYGEAKKAGGGMTLSKAVVEDVLGLPIHYVAVINFFQFRTFIDSIGGIDVVVPKGFVDTEYPIEGKENDECGGDPLYRCRYETVEFLPGLVHMDGARALIYVRSRHAEGREGTDFSRGGRQQDVLVAVKTKILSLEPWKNPVLALTLFQAVGKTMTSNLLVSEVIALGKVTARIDPVGIKRISLESLLTEAPYDRYGRYALEPINGISEVHEFIKNQLK
jgi:LCP family protein required for cell wall assembly